MEKETDAIKLMRPVIQYKIGFDQDSVLHGIDFTNFTYASEISDWIFNVNLDTIEKRLGISKKKGEHFKILSIKL